MPFYSIVIPTRDRAHLLRHALRSALNQIAGDYEIVVSDNHSSDNTPDVVKQAGSSRIRYFRTPETYPMPDSWEFALSKAAGEWITFLTDDSAISSRLLERVDDARRRHPSIKVISWSHFSRYYHDTWHEAPVRNTLTYHPYAGKETEYPSRPLLKKFYELQGDHTAPVALNSMTRRDLIEEIIRDAGRFFIHPCPDLSSAAEVLAKTDRYLYLDWPLGINGIGKESIGMAQATTRGEAAKKFHQEFKDGPLFQQVPISAPVVVNYIAESLLRVKKALPLLFESLDIDWGLYFYFCGENMNYLEQKGVDVGAEREELRAVFRRQPFGVKAGFYSWTVKKNWEKLQIAHRIRNFIRTQINRSQVLAGLESAVRQRPHFGEMLAGSKEGFSNICEAMNVLDRRVFGHA